MVKGSVHMKELTCQKAPLFPSFLPGFPMCGLICQL